MHSQLKTTASTLRKAEIKAYCRRVMWLSFENRLRAVFTEISGQSTGIPSAKTLKTIGGNTLANQGADAGVLGNLYLTSIHSGLGYNKRGIYRHNAINQAQIHTGWRRLPVWHLIKADDPTKPKQAMEQGACIWFSQDITGKVTVFISPYKSDLMKVTENELILKWDLDPNDLTERAIRRLVNTFLRYCVATSMISGGSYRNGFFRLWLRFRDIRNRKAQRTMFFIFVEKLMLVLLTGLGTWFAYLALK